MNANHIFDQAQSAVLFETEDRLWMELNRFERQFPVAHAHNDAVIRFRRNLKHRRQLLRQRIQRMVAADFELRRQAFEDPATAMDHR